MYENGVFDCIMIILHSNDADHNNGRGDIVTDPGKAALDFHQQFSQLTTSRPTENFW